MVPANAPPPADPASVCICSEKRSKAAIGRGLPGTASGGWSHYCFAAATDEGTPGKLKRCWSRPGTQSDYCSLGINLPGALQTKAHSPYGIANLDDDERDWTAVARLAGGTAPDGTTVGNPLACSLLTAPYYIYVIDTPIEVTGQ